VLRRGRQRGPKHHAADAHQRQARRRFAMVDRSAFGDGLRGIGGVLSGRRGRNEAMRPSRAAGTTIASNATDTLTGVCLSPQQGRSPFFEPPRRKAGEAFFHRSPLQPRSRTWLIE
jgi:hypothetical protein